MKLHSPPIMDFDDYYFTLNPYTNKRNPWFQEFWQQKFKCRLEGPDADYTYSTPCTGKWMTVRVGNAHAHIRTHAFAHTHYVI